MGQMTYSCSCEKQGLVSGLEEGEEKVSILLQGLAVSFCEGEAVFPGITLFPLL